MFFTIFRPLLTLWLWIFFPIRVHGKDKLIQDGNTVIICNHLRKTDIFYVGYLFKGKTYYLAKKEWFDKKWLGWILKLLGGIPVDRDNPDYQSVKASLKVLKSGKRLCIFPEGTRNRHDTEIQPLHGGAAMLAFKTKAKIIPLNIHEPAKFFKKNDIYVGEPFDFSEFEGERFDSELNHKLTQMMYEKMCKARDEQNELLENEKAVKQAKKDAKKAAKRARKAAKSEKKKK